MGRRVVAEQMSTRDDSLHGVGSGGCELAGGEERGLDVLLGQRGKDAVQTVAVAVAVVVLAAPNALLMPDGGGTGGTPGRYTTCPTTTRPSAATTTLRAANDARAPVTCFAD